MTKILNEADDAMECGGSDYLYVEVLLSEEGGPWRSWPFILVVSKVQGELVVFKLFQDCETLRNWPGQPTWGKRSIRKKCSSIWIKEWIPLTCAWQRWRRRGRGGRGSTSSPREVDEARRNDLGVAVHQSRLPVRQLPSLLLVTSPLLLVPVGESCNIKLW